MSAYLYSLNFPNGKRYIGMSKNAAKRFKSHACAASNAGELPVHKAIRKFAGKVELQILCVGSREYILDMEVAAIAAYDTQNRKFGYNSTAGGDGASVGNKNVLGKHWVCSEETKRRVSESKIGNKHCVGRKLRQSHAAALLASNVSRKGEFWITDGEASAKCKCESLIPDGWHKGRVGKAPSEETRLKMSAAQKKRHLQ